MKKITLLTFLLLSNIVFSQSLTIYKTDQTSDSFDLSQVDSITFSTTPPAQVLNLSNWECIVTEPVVEQVTPAKGVFECVTEGLKIYGNDSQTNKAVHLAANSSAIDNSIFLKWKTNSDGSMMNITIDLYSDSTNWFPSCRVLNLSTNYASDGSNVISDDTWYYTRITVTSNSASVVTATDNYDNIGGTVIAQESTLLSGPVQNFTFGTKANKVSCVLLSEVRIK